MINQSRSERHGDHVFKAADTGQLRQRLREGQSKVPASSAKDVHTINPAVQRSPRGSEGA